MPQPYSRPRIITRVVGPPIIAPPPALGMLLAINGLFPSASGGPVDGCINPATGLTMPFNSSIDNCSPSTIPAMLENWRIRGHRGFLKPTPSTGPWCTIVGGIQTYQEELLFAEIDRYGTAQIVEAIAEAIEGGWLAGVYLMDEPNRNSDDNNPNPWGPKGHMTKPTLDRAAQHWKSYHPTCPTGHAIKHTWRVNLPGVAVDPFPGPGGPENEHYEVVDFIVCQTWRTDYPPPASETPAAFRDSALGVQAAERLVSLDGKGVAIMLALNLYSGPGDEDPPPPTLPCVGRGLSPDEDTCLPTRAEYENWMITFATENAAGRRAAAIGGWRHHPDLWALTDASPGGSRKKGLGVVQAHLFTLPLGNMFRT